MSQRTSSDSAVIGLTTHEVEHEQAVHSVKDNSTGRKRLSDGCNYR